MDRGEKANLDKSEIKSFGRAAAPSFSTQVRRGEPGAPVQFLVLQLRVQTTAGLSSHAGYLAPA